MDAGTLPTLWTDFNSVSDDGLLRASRSLAPYDEELHVGQRVYLSDGEGNSCVAVIVNKKAGPLLKLEPDWSTWRSTDFEVVPAAGSSPSIVISTGERAITGTRALQPA